MFVCLNLVVFKVFVRIMKRFVLFSVAFCWVVFALGQQVIRGSVTDSLGRALENINVSVLQTAYGTATDASGNFLIECKFLKKGVVQFSGLGFRAVSRSFVMTSTRDSKEFDVSLAADFLMLDQVDVTQKAREGEGMKLIELKSVSLLPGVASNIESLVKTLPGVFSSNEMSNQYTVRGGNFDENLVFINGIEIYRPALIRSGQQEGLSVINPDLVEKVYFSAGGWGAEYGDKLSSVLDITYKNSSYLLGSLETNASYKPSFADVQSLVSWRINDACSLDWFANFTANRYLYVPKDLTSNFGTRSNALSLFIDFEGSEKDDYAGLANALSFVYKPSDRVSLKLIASGYNTQESETYDIGGRYLLSSVADVADFGTETLKNLIGNLGVGRFLQHGRNYYNGEVYKLSHRGSVVGDHTVLSWGVEFQREWFRNSLLEWELLDSAGFALPPREQTGGGDANTLRLSKNARASYAMSSYRFAGFAALVHKWDDNLFHYTLNFGLRTGFWQGNKVSFLNPRLGMEFSPISKSNHRVWFSVGAYEQALTYKEVINLEGEILIPKYAQRSWQGILGYEYNFRASGRPFRFTAELYYKYMPNLIPYQVENLRIKYLPELNAKGFAEGLDLRIFGEFVKGIDSWFSLSLLKSAENIGGDDDGFLATPSDRRYQVSIYFQDYFPNNDSWKLYIGATYSDGVPFGPPNSRKTSVEFRLPAYKRLDVGVSKLLTPNIKIFQNRMDVLLSLEVYNLLDIENVVGYQWVKVVPNTASLTGYFDLYGVPSHLTGRLVNFKCSLSF
jgi:hypothetical protein